ncbi:MAG: PilZ domain-containing protein [Defluviitaleaceae bacterium]|nr:PilZ domain-containing protein [Defluviitaleaceae bacterium]
MELRFIEDGTKMDIQVFSEKNPHLEEKTYLGTFLGIDRGVDFFVQCDDLYVHSASFSRECFLNISFFKGAEVCIFRARVGGTETIRGHFVLVLTAITPIEKHSRRKSPRLEASFPVNIYDGDELLYKETTSDISNGGLCVVTNLKLSLEQNREYELEFSIGFNQVFKIPAKLVRSGNCHQTISYRFDHAFIFEIYEDSDIRSKLALALFDYRIKNM